MLDIKGSHLKPSTQNLTSPVIAMLEGTVAPVNNETKAQV